MGGAAMIMLDTHSLIWFASAPQHLSQAALTAIERELAASRKILLSSISVWEICHLVQKGRVSFSVPLEEFVQTLNTVEEYQFAPVDNQVVYESHVLPGEFHQDPADRMIVATARLFDAVLVTKDQKIRDYGHLQTIW
jgi:PIN domain nuclease of toxin-antitoxin system